MYGYKTKVLLNNCCFRQPHNKVERALCHCRAACSTISTPTFKRNRRRKLLSPCWQHSDNNPAVFGRFRPLHTQPTSRVQTFCRCTVVVHTYSTPTIPPVLLDSVDLTILLSAFLRASSNPPKSQFYGNNTTSATPRCDGCSVQCFTEHSPTLTEPRPSFLRQNSHICRVHTACLWPPAGLNAHEHIGPKQHKMAGTCNWHRRE